MADKSKFGQTAPPAGAPAPDADPFAELTRIMGFDPRVPAESQAQTDAASNDQFAESIAEIDAPAEPPIAADVATAVSSQIAHVEAAEEFSDDFGIDLERELMGDFLASEAPSALADEGDEAFDAAFVDDLASFEAVDGKAQIDLEADVDALNKAFGEAVASETTIPAESLSGADDDDEFDAVFVAELADDEVDNVFVEAPEAPVAVASADVDLDLDFDFDDIDSAIEREMDQALLGRSTVPDAVSATADDEAFESALADSFDDLDAANASDPVPPTVAAGAVDEFALLERDLASGIAWEGTGATPSRSPQSERPDSGAKHAVSDAGLDDLIAALEAASARSTRHETGGSNRPASNEDANVAAAKMSDYYQTRNNQDFRHFQDRGAQRRASAPEIETTEMYDRAHSLVDDLDLPDVAYDEPVHAASEIDLEFDNLLNEMSRGEPVARQASMSRGYDQHDAYGRGSEAQQTARQPASPAFEQDYGFDSVFAQPETAPVAQPAGRAQYAQPQQAYRDQVDEFSGFEFDDSDFDEGHTPSNPVYRNSDRGGRGGRGMMIAALVGGVALLGGIGAFTMSWGSGSGAPVLVQADGSPVKVRPENPGGSAVPHQDSAVYDTVSRSGGVDQPVQQRLVSGTEEPIAIPQPNDMEDDELAALTKGEDRIQPTEASANGEQDPLAVAPRKVRTMVVKPDGTLVPAEMPAVNAGSAEPTIEDIANTPAGEPEQITTGATQASPAKRVAAAPVAAGGWSVQVASQPSEAGATKSMADISKRYAGVIGDRGSNIVKAEVEGKGTYWRVRVAAASRDDAVSLCANLKSAGGSCFVTR